MSIKQLFSVFSVGVALFLSTTCFANNVDAVNSVSAKVTRSGEFVAEINLLPSPNSVSIAMEEVDDNYFDLYLDEKQNTVTFDFKSAGNSDIGCTIELQATKGEQVFNVGQYQFIFKIK